MAENKNKKSRSEKERIKNITEIVHPHGAETADADDTADDSEERKRARHEHQESLERRRRIRMRKRFSAFAKLVAAFVIILALAFCVITVKNLNTGTGHDNSGVAAYDKGDYDTAVKEFKEAVSYDTKNAGYYIHLGMAYIGQKSYDEALGYFKQASACAENDTEKILTARGQGLAYLYQGSYKDAAASFDTALSYSGKSLTADLQEDMLYYQAEAYESLSDYKSAVVSYTDILKITGSDAMALMKRGLAYEKLEDYSAAETDLYAAVKKSKKSYAVYKALYESLQKQGKTDEAKKVLEQALELSGNSGEDLYYRGTIYLDLSDTANAGSMFDKSYAKGYKAALLGKGEISIKSEDYKSACAYYEKYFSEAGSSSSDTGLGAKAYNQYALCLIKLGRYDDAVTACQSGLAYNSRDTEASLTFNLIVAYEDLEQWEKAYSTAKTYHEKYPDDANGTHEFEFLESRMAQ